MKCGNPNCKNNLKMYRGIIASFYFCSKKCLQMARILGRETNSGS